VQYLTNLAVMLGLDEMLQTPYSYSYSFNFTAGRLTIEAVTGSLGLLQIGEWLVGSVQESDETRDFSGVHLHR
jgi:hypothetical protein